MGLDLIPQDLRNKYTFAEREDACAILATDFPTQWDDILACLRAFNLKKSYVIIRGNSSVMKS